MRSAEPHRVASWSRRLRNAIKNGDALIAAPPSVRPIIPAEAIRRTLLDPPLTRDPAGLRIYGFRIAGALILDNIQTELPVDFHDCYFTSDISVYGGRFSTVHIGSCLISGDFMGTTLSVAHNFNVDDSTFRGTVTCMGMRIGGQLSFADVRIECQRGDDTVRTQDNSYDVMPSVFTIDRTTVDGPLVLNGLRCPGPISASGVTASSIRAEQSQLGKPGDVLNFVNLQSTRVSHSLSFEGSRIAGTLSLSGSDVQAIYLNKVIIQAGSRVALDLERCSIRENIYLLEAQIDGELALNATSVKQIRFEGSHLRNPDADWAVTGEQLTATTVLLRDVRVEGFVDFMSAEIGHIITDDSRPDDRSLAPVLKLTGSEFKEVSGYPMNSRHDAAAWLERTPEAISAEFVAEPWHVLAQIMDRHGRPEDARWLRWQAAKRATKSTSGLSRISRTLYGLFAAHGYYAGRRALMWLTMVLVTLCVVASVAAPQFHPVPQSDVQVGDITGATPCEQLPKDSLCFSPVLIALETVVPTTGQAQTAKWQAAGPPVLLVFLALARLSGWVFTVLLLAALTGLLRKT